MVCRLSMKKRSKMWKRGSLPNAVQPGLARRGSLFSIQPQEEEEEEEEEGQVIGAAALPSIFQNAMTNQSFLDDLQYEDLDGPEMD